MKRNCNGNVLITNPEGENRRKVIDSMGDPQSVRRNCRARSWVRVTSTLILVLSVLLCGSKNASAWNATAHKIVASVAFRQLPEVKRESISEALRQHPRFKEDFLNKMPEEILSADALTQSEWIFQQAAIWPDLARGFRGENRKFHRSTWHYINRPQYLTEPDRTALAESLKLNLELTPPTDALQDMNIVQVIRFCRAKIVDAETTPADKALYLSWLFHNVGDLHQPMHSTAMFSQALFPKGDRGGNSIPTEQGKNLHSLWDNLPGRDSSFRDCRNRAIGYLADARVMEIGDHAAKILDEAIWLDESFQSAQKQAYAPELILHLQRVAESASPKDLPAIHLSDDYLKASGSVARRQMVMAGFRLGAVLDLSFPD